VARWIPAEAEVVWQREWGCVLEVRVWNSDRPQGSRDAFQILGVGDVLVPQEFSPGAIGRVSQVMGRTLALCMPACRSLVRCLPQEASPRVRVPKASPHAADPAPTSHAARSRTRPTSSPSGSNPPSNTSAGVRPSSCGRGRENHRRIPRSL